MSLIECRECGNKISTKSKICPSCGVPSPARNPTSRPLKLAIIFIVLAGIGYILELANPPSREQVSGSSLPSRDERREQFPEKRLELLEKGRRFLAEGKAASVAGLLSPWIFIGDDEITALSYQAREQQLVNELMTIPVSEHAANEVRYEELTQIRPENDRFKEKLNFYRSKSASADGRGRSEQPVAKTLRSGNIGHTLLLDMIPAERSKTLSSVVELNGEACGGGEGTFFQGVDEDRAAYWNLACSNGSNYSIKIEPDANGTSTILECNFLEFISGVPCFTPFH